MKSLIQSIYKGSRVLYYTGLIHLFLGLVFLALMGIDSRMVYQESVWLKPIRFAISIFLFTWTFAWFSGLFQDKPRLIKVLNFLIAACMFIEIALISMQSFRGVASHFNVSTTFDAMVYAVMGGVIGFNGIVVTIWFLIFVWLREAGGRYRKAVIWGMFLFMLGNLAGFLLTIYSWPSPDKDTADALAVTRWKTDFRDLRIAHAIGLHAIQILPLSCWVLIKLNWDEKWIHGVGAGYFIIYFLAAIYGLGVI